MLTRSMERVLRHWRGHDEVQARATRRLELPGHGQGVGRKSCATPASTCREVEQGYVGYAYESTSGQRSSTEAGISSASATLCSTGSALLGAQVRRTGRLRVGAGLRKMRRRSGGDADDRESPLSRHGVSRDRQFEAFRWRNDQVGGGRPRALHGHREAFREDRLQEPQALGHSPYAHRDRHPGRHLGAE